MEDSTEALKRLPDTKSVEHLVLASPSSSCSDQETFFEDVMKTYRHFAALPDITDPTVAELGQSEPEAESDQSERSSSPSSPSSPSLSSPSSPSNLQRLKTGVKTVMKELQVVSLLKSEDVCVEFEVIKDISVVVCGSEIGFIDLILTSKKSDGSVVDKQSHNSFVYEYLCTFPLRCSATAVLNRLFSRLPDAQLHPQDHSRVAMNLLGFLIVWAHIFARDFCEPESETCRTLQAELDAFTQRPTLSGNPMIHKAALKIKELVKKSQIKPEKSIEATPVMPHVTQMNPLHFAQQLVFVVTDLRAQVDRVQWTATESPTILPYIEWSKSFCLFVTSQILEAEPLALRVQTVRFFLSVCVESWELENFQSVWDIVSCLRSQPVARLHKLWMGIGSRDRALFDRLKALMASSGNYYEYRKASSKTKCQIDIMHVFLQDLNEMKMHPEEQRNDGSISMVRAHYLALILQRIYMYQPAPSLKKDDVFIAWMSRLKPTKDKSALMELSFALQPVKDERHVFGADLDALVDRTGEEAFCAAKAVNVPKGGFLGWLNFLRNGHPEKLECEGLFRQSGNQQRMNEIQTFADLNHGNLPTTYFGPHDVCSVLKLFLKSIPGGLIDYKVAESLEKISVPSHASGPYAFRAPSTNSLPPSATTSNTVPREKSDLGTGGKREEELRICVSEISNCLKKLSQVKQDLLICYLSFLNEIAAAPNNKMTHSNLSLCCSPTVYGKKSSWDSMGRNILKDSFQSSSQNVKKTMRQRDSLQKMCDIFLIMLTNVSDL
eukprot:Lithocolla_globosa_v1_NODE_1558_length_2456_cov_12.517879.p1 type:complete len:778 gc:universal NODE_1558_length_2456_cov_12.517879:2408-75(-)